MSFKQTFANENKFREAYGCLGNFVNDNNWAGACHATTAILYIIAKKLGIKAVPCMGETVYSCFPPFDHSWLTIDNKVYDIAIMYTLNGDMGAGSVYKGIDLRTEKPTEVIYGISYMGLGDIAMKNYKKDIYTYIIESKNMGIDLMKILFYVCEQCDIKISRKWVKENCSKDYWMLCVKN